MGKEQRLQVKIDESQEKWQLLTFNLRKLEEERILETDPAQISHLRERIDAVKAERKEIEQELSDLEQQLKDIERKTSKIDKPFIKSRKKILILSANPKTTPRLRLDEEAFEFGRNALQLYSIPEHSIPILRKSHRELKSFQNESIVKIKQPDDVETPRIKDSSKSIMVSFFHTMKIMVINFWKDLKIFFQVHKIKKSDKISELRSVESLSATRETLQRDFSLLELKSLSLDIGLDVSQIRSKSVDLFVSELITKAQKLNKLENLISVVERIRVSKETETTRKFLDNAGFDIRRISGSEDFIAIPRISLWKERFPKGIYVSIWRYKPLDHEAVFTICRKAQKYTDHALVVTNQQPELDGWMTIAGKRLNTKHPFILIPTTDTFIEEGLVLKNVRRKFANYVEKYIGKGYNPYDVRDPVFDVINFFGREGIMDEIEGDLKLGKKLGLFGIHKMGKSSVLKTLQRRLKSPIWLHLGIPISATKY